MSINYQEPEFVNELFDDYWEEHPEVPFSDWQYEVANGDTRCSYWVYVHNKLTEEAEDNFYSEEVT